MSHEISVTEEHPKKPKKYINFPLVVPGNEDVAEILERGGKLSPAHYERARDYAMKKGRPDSTDYDSIDEAVKAAQKRSREHGESQNEKTLLRRWFSR